MQAVEEGVAWTSGFKNRQHGHCAAFQQIQVGQILLFILFKNSGKIHVLLESSCCVEDSRAFFTLEFYTLLNALQVHFRDIYVDQIQ